MSEQSREWAREAGYRLERQQAEINLLQAEIERLRFDLKLRDDIIGLSPDGDRHAHLVDEIERLKRIVGCVVRNLKNCDDTAPRDEPGPLCGPTWHKVAYVCGLGSTSALALCREFDVDPDYDCAVEIPFDTPEEKADE